MVLLYGTQPTNINLADLTHPQPPAALPKQPSNTPKAVTCPTVPLRWGDL